jgi:hypothetical protein
VSKYKINPADRIETSIYVDTRHGHIKILIDRCLHRQGTAPCDGDVKAPCKAKFDGCNCTLKVVSTDEIGRMKSVGVITGDADNPEILPEGIYKETAFWKKENWRIRQMIDEESTITDSTGRRHYSLERQRKMRIKYLLSDWTLKDDDPTFAIKKKLNIGEDAVVEEIDPKVYRVILNEVAPEIITAFIDSYERKMLEPYFVAEQEAIDMLKDEAGINAKN